ncbi:hypothetical protein [Paenibacillus monticola]|uniref:Uncharacterized protein n=1 Tax=Paenibacillus monticola TaxID=2666075 RepID=A0A7X2H9V1_9BACL|nr:hypothetical protein [Paenibacillus monticola]MRN56085.1 hypothetical protein [Paenibacillus monticola]
MKYALLGSMFCRIAYSALAAYSQGSSNSLPLNVYDILEQGGVYTFESREDFHHALPVESFYPWNSYGLSLIPRERDGYKTLPNKSKSSLYSLLQTANYQAQKANGGTVGMGLQTRRQLCQRKNPLLLLVVLRKD